MHIHVKKTKQEESHHPHRVHHAALLPQHFLLLVLLGHHDGLPLLLRPLQLQPKRVIQRVKHTTRSWRALRRILSKIMV